MKSFTRYRYKIAIGVGVVAGSLGYFYLNSPKEQVYASWTTNYEVPPYARWDPNWDHRSPKFMVSPRHGHDEKDDNRINQEIERLKPKVMRHIILIRHGQYNVEGQTDEERNLTKLGRIQADYTGKRLKELSFPYNKIVKSTMSRAQETGKIICSVLPEVPTSNCDLIREGAPIPPEPPLGGWKQEAHFFVDGARIEAAFRKYFHREDPKAEHDTYTVLVCHANVIRYFVCRALQFPPEGWLRLSLNHASITWISITPRGRVILRCLGDTGHMPPEVITSH